ncbi:MAG: folylpolyglutamate synthase/dihydrofolate synthase family protein [Thermodesulfovibrionales bacterium]
MRNTDYSNAIDYLYGLQKYGIKFGLDNTIRLLALLGNPQDSFKSIHIAGTNGKGSTSAMIASILRAAGLKVGLFTSPHLVSFTERIRVDGVEITEKEVVELTKEIRDVVFRSQKLEVRSQNIEHDTRHSSLVTRYPLSPTFFEFVTAMAFLYFKRRGVGWAVVETGMGGRLDATNVITPAVSVITNISYDHREFLGETLKEIAMEKAGIIKKKVPVVSARQEDEAEEVICRTARERSSHLFIYEKDFRGTLRSSGIDGITFDYIDDSCIIKDLHIPLAGEHQLSNACLAIKASLITLKSSSELQVTSNKSSLVTAVKNSSLIREGLAITKWPGRLELIRNAKAMVDVLIDGAHNPSASEVLAQALRKFYIPSYREIILILGIMADKDIEGIMRPLLPLASRVIMTAPGYERAAHPSRLAECACSLGYHADIADSVEEAIGMAIRNSNKLQVTGRQAGKPISQPPEYFDPLLIVIAGSFYTTGEAKMVLGQESNCPSLAGLR